MKIQLMGLLISANMLTLCFMYYSNNHLYSPFYASKYLFNLQKSSFVSFFYTFSMLYMLPNMFILLNCMICYEFGIHQLVKLSSYSKLFYYMFVSGSVQTLMYNMVLLELMSPKNKFSFRGVFDINFLPIVVTITFFSVLSFNSFVFLLLDVLLMLNRVLCSSSPYMSPHSQLKKYLFIVSMLLIPFFYYYSMQTIFHLTFEKLHFSNLYDFYRNYFDKVSMIMINSAMVLWPG